MSANQGKQLIVGAERDTKVLKALASDMRVQILRVLGQEPRNVSELAKFLGTSPSAVTANINQLEDAGLVTSRSLSATRGTQKMVSRTYESVLVMLPPIADEDTGRWLQYAMPLGNFSQVRAAAPCGILSEDWPLGQLDDPASFYLPERSKAQHIYFSHGFIEYHFPGRIPPGYAAVRLDISAEICSEYPMCREDWPSDITLWVNDVEVCTYTSPGDFGGHRGLLTPKWWPQEHSQYGLLKRWTITSDGGFLDGELVSEVRMGDFCVDANPFVSVRLGVKDSALHKGGLNLFGERFGNYAQNIVLQIELVRK